MNVSNKKCIRRLSFRTFAASKKRNTIAILAIALTTILFTSLFTIAMSLNSSYQDYTFRQIGGYNHGTFKEVTPEQIEKLSAHPKVKKYGVRTTFGYNTSGIYSKVPAEFSYMDENTTKWSYVTPTTGRMPASGKEVTMDTKLLSLLDIEPELGAEITLSWEENQNTTPRQMTDTFTLVGWWEFDSLSPVHFINFSEEYVTQLSEEAVSQGLEPYRTDMNIMLSSSLNIRGVMESIDTDLGYQWEIRNTPDCVRIGVNWGYTSAELNSNMDPQVVISIISFVLLVIFTGYLIIYNIFRISVSEDVRFYGLLKTIGVTPKQIRRIISHQALFLSIIGIPLGSIIGYGIGSLLTPAVLSMTTLEMHTTISFSPMIFIGSSLFSLVTVFLSCLRPGRQAARVSPVEATKYTEASQITRKQKQTRGAKIYQMAWANLGRSRGKTILVILSLSLAVTLLTILYLFTTGFNMEKYLAQNTAADFLVGHTDYFRFDSGKNSNDQLEGMIEFIKDQVEISDGGSGYTLISDEHPKVWMPKSDFAEQLAAFMNEEEIDLYLQQQEQDGDLVSASLLLEALDKNLLNRVQTIEGDLAPLLEPSQNAIAIQVDVDDYNNVYGDYPDIGSTLRVTYVDEGYFIDTRTGNLSDENTPPEYLRYKISKSHDVEYTVCALVNVPYKMSMRYGVQGYSALLSEERLRQDSQQTVQPIFYLFDTPDEEAEAEAETFLSELTSGDDSEIMYESKKTVREEFENFQQMFLLLGGILCFIIGLVGILNFFNAIMTGILSRRREFAVLQSIGMTGKQLKQMLIFEGLFYALATVLLSLLMGILLSPLIGNLLEKMFWFFTYHLTLLPVLFTAPIFLLLGVLLPLLIYRAVCRSTVVERLRENE